MIKTFEPGTLVRLSEAVEEDVEFTVRNIDTSQPGWQVERNSVAMIIKLLKHIPDDARGDNDEISYIVLVNGKTGCVYHEDCTEVVTQ